MTTAASTRMFRHHGGRVDAARAQFQDAPADWIDLSTGVSPYAYPAKTSGNVRALPSPDALAALEAIAATYLGGVDPALVVAVPGSDLALRLLAGLLPVGSVGVAGPGYGGHSAMWNRETAPIAFNDVDSARHDVLILANPNNPDGNALTAGRLHGIAGRVGWLIVDEAFADLQPEHSLAAAGLDNVIVLRSFGKFFGLAGLRLGFVVAPLPMANRLRRQLGDWPISGPAIAIATTAYADTRWQTRQRMRLARDAARLDRVLAAAGLTPAGGTDLFRLVLATDADRLFLRLANAGILVRPFANDNHRLRFGLPGRQHWQRLAAAIKGQDHG